MKRSGIKVMAKLVGLVKPLTLYMLLAISMGLIGHLMATFISILAGYGILSILGYDNAPSLTVLFSLMIGFALLRGVLRYGEQECNHFIAFKLLALLRDKIFTKLRQLAPAKLEGKDSGDLISLITSDIELLEVFYAHTISPIAIAILFGFVMVLFIASYSLKLALFALIGYLIIGWLIPLISSVLSSNNGINYRNQSASLSSYVLETLHGLDEIIQYNQERNRLLSVDNKTKDLLKVESKMKSILGINSAFTNTIIFILDISMLMLSLSLTNATTSVIVTIAFMSSFGPFVALAALGSTLQNTFAAGNRVLDILEESPLVNEIDNGQNINFNGVNVNNVSFAYDQDFVLNDVSLIIPKRTIVGLQGKSGCGKSTLLRLLMRFWDTTSGTIDIDLINIKRINTQSLRDNESFMTQDTYLFRDTIKNNLKIAKLDASDREIIAACKKVSIHDFIKALPNGYDTQVAELGQSLSAGERQRLGLARAFLHDALFMLLDEPTSNLDSLNEAIILKSIYEQKGNKTVVLVSHMPSTLKLCDTIYKLDQGRVS